MAALSRVRIFAAAFSLGLALVLGVFVYGSSAADARFYSFGPTTATCDRTGQTVAAGFQGDTLGIELQGFWDSEPVYLSFTFPDGRVFSPVVTGPDTVNTPVGLDGLIDMPPNFPWLFYASRGGDFAYTFATTAKWPYGCYTFTALGAFSNRQAGTSFVVTPRVGPSPDPGPTTLDVSDNTTGDPSGLHGALVDINGRGFQAREVVSVWITAPDGTVLDYPQQQTSDIGSFASTFRFDETYPAGRYAFTALGTASGYQVITHFDLAARPSTPNGWAALRVASPFPPSDGHRALFEVQGKRFAPSERVDIWMTLPDGGVRGLPSQFANEIGEFFAEIYLDERLPTGRYAFTAKGASSGHLVITELFLEAGSPHVTAEPPDEAAVPRVEDSNTGAGTLGSGGEQPGIDTLDPQPEPAF